MTKDMSWDEAIRDVLGKSSEALHYYEIADRIVLLGLRSKVGATPRDTVASILSVSLKDPESPFQRVARGEYTLKENLAVDSTANVEAVAEEGATTDSGAIRAFGMFWQRDWVDWSGKPKLLGRQLVGALEVNFSEQIGVYLLHDRDRVIYVGRAADTLLARVRTHTTDRLGGRWDRLSWFGLRAVGPEGGLQNASPQWTHTVVIDTLEALLIESLEPPLNRKRGDSFSAVEYLQVIDPNIEKPRKARVIADMAKAAGLTG